MAYPHQRHCFCPENTTPQARRVARTDELGHFNTHDHDLMSLVKVMTVHMNVIELEI